MLLGEYHHFDIDVYPMNTKVSKGPSDRSKAGLKARWSDIRIFSLPSTQTEEVKEVVHELPSREELAARCLQFYLEPYKNVLLQKGEYPNRFKVDSLVTEITHIYSLLHEPWVNGHKWTIPLMATVSTIL